MKTIYTALIFTVMFSLLGCAQTQSSKWAEWKAQERERDRARLAEQSARAELMAQASAAAKEHIAETAARLPELRKAAREKGIKILMEDYKAKGIAVSPERATELWDERKAHISATFAEMYAADKAKYQMEALTAEVAGLRSELAQQSSQELARNRQRSYEAEMLRMDIEYQNILLMDPRNRRPFRPIGY